MFKEQSTEDRQPISQRKLDVVARILIYGLLVVAVVAVGWLYFYSNNVMYENDEASNIEANIGESDSASVHERSLYFSGIPVDGSNLFPNIFKLSLASDAVSQITGEGYPESMHMSYFESELYTDEFFVIIPGPVNEEAGYTQMEPIMVYDDPDEPLDSGIKTAQDISQTSGAVSHSFSLSPQESHFSFATLFNSGIENQVLVNNPENWTVVVDMADMQEQRKLLTIPEATNPIWFDEGRLMYIRENGVYVNSVLENTEYQLFSASDLDYASFTNSDKIAFLHHDEGVIMTILKSNQNEIISVLLDSELRPGFQDNYSIFNRFQYVDDSVSMHHPLSLDDDQLAVVLVDKQNVLPDELVVYRLGDDKFTEIYRRTMAEFLPDSTILNYAQTPAAFTTTDDH